MGFGLWVIRWCSQVGFVWVSVLSVSDCEVGGRGVANVWSGYVCMCGWDSAGCQSL